MTDDDKKFVDDAESGTWAGNAETIERLCRIVRELEAENEAWCKHVDRLLAEIENAPWVYQRNSEPYTGKDFDTGVWTEHKRASHRNWRQTFG